jgi:hypothetical protein
MIDKEPFSPTCHNIKYSSSKKTAVLAASFDYKYVAIHYEPITLITVAIINIIAKKPKETINPTPESIASLRLSRMSFSK